MLILGLFLVGIFLLVKGADIFLEYASRLAYRFSISELVVGLTLGAIGTSMPEIFVSYIAAIAGSPGIALGNASGSNMANIGLALGIGALFLPIKIEEDLLKKDFPVLIFSSLLFLLFSLNMRISRLESLIMLSLGSVYVFSLYRRRKTGVVCDDICKEESLIIIFVMILTGLAMLLYGAHTLVKSAANIALTAGVSETFVALTAIAVGTSLPELAVVVSGSLKGRHKISAGTVVGSNIFNYLIVAGGAGVIGGKLPFSIEEYYYQAPAVFLFSIILFPIILTGRRINRFEGTLLFAIYSLYIAVLALF